MATKKVAIACQGGGTHAAFTWGVLTQILKTKQEWDAADGDSNNFEITGFSGTSAGALCALAAWYGLTPNSIDGCGSTKRAIENLECLWKSFAAVTPVELLLNAAVVTASDLKEQGVPFPSVDPYRASTEVAFTGLATLGVRAEYLSFDPLLNKLCPHFDKIEWEKVAQTKLRMIAGAVEVQSGNFEVFDSAKTLEEKHHRLPRKKEDPIERWQQRRPLSLAGVAASGTLPEVLRARRIADTEFPSVNTNEPTRRDAYYWDGMYSQNPPVRLLLDECKDDKPHEIWVIRINPQEMQNKLSGLEDIRDRTNELAGNLSLNAELDYILKMNHWQDENRDKQHPVFANKRKVIIRTIKMKRDTVRELNPSTKFDRGRLHLERLYSEGMDVGRQWLNRWRTERKRFAEYPDDAGYVDQGDQTPSHYFDQDHLF